jgi:hypothetical protein
MQKRTIKRLEETTDIEFAKALLIEKKKMLKKLVKQKSQESSGKLTKWN